MNNHKSLPSSITLAYARANMIASLLFLTLLPVSILVLAFLADVQGALEQLWQFSLLAVFFITFGLSMLARSMNRLTIDQGGLKGRWYWMPVSVPWSEVVGISKLNTSLGLGIKLRIKSRSTRVRSISLSSIYENYHKVMPMLRAKGYTFSDGTAPTSITPDTYVPSNMPAKSVRKGLRRTLPILLSYGCLSLLLVRAFGANRVTHAIVGLGAILCARYCVQLVFETKRR